jgi:hypothetical protein
MSPEQQALLGLFSLIQPVVMMAWEHTASTGRKTTKTTVKERFITIPSNIYLLV